MDQRGPESWTLRVSEEEANGFRVLVLDGRLGFASVETFENALNATISTNGLILDISGVDYISSGALKVLDHRTQVHPPLVIAGACEAVKLTLEFSGMGAGLTMAGSRSEAVTFLLRDRPLSRRE